jgi:monothiol glutaredoxin
MPRSLRGENRIHALHEKIASDLAQMVQEVEAVVAVGAVLAAGVRQNPFPKQTRKLLDAAGLARACLEYGRYFSGRRRRLARSIGLFSISV